MKTFYRYNDYIYANGGDEYSTIPPDIEVELSEYPLIKETPCGYWISLCEVNLDPSSKKWTSKTAIRRFAYPTKEEALNSFIKRKKRQVAILTFNLHRAKTALSIAEKKVEVVE